MHQGIWVTQIEARCVLNQIALVNNIIWACGTKNSSESCTVLHMNTGSILTQYTLVGKEFTGLVQGVDSNHVILGSRSTAVADNTIVEEKDINKRKDSDLALVIGGSIAGGLLALFLSKWFLQLCIYLHKRNKKRIAKKEIVQASIRATDPEQQRMVEEALRQRCEAAVSRGPKSSAAGRVAQDSREDDRQIERSMRSPPRSAGGFASGPPAEICTDDDYQYIAAGAFAQGAYINGARSVAAPSQEEVKPIKEYVAPPRKTGSPSNDSSSLNISSLHRSERSDVSYYNPSEHHNQKSAEESHSEMSENSEFSEISDENSGSDNDGDSQDGELFSTSSNTASGANSC
eukprot:gene19709-22410_t